MDFDALPDLLQRYMPTRPWAQNLVYMALLVLVATVAQWVVARVVSRVAHRLLVIARNGHWSRALMRHRVYRRFGYAVWFAIITVGAGEVPNIGRYAQAVERVTHAGTWICIFTMLAGALGAWQDVFAGTRRAQTRSIKGYVQVGRLGLWLVCGVLVLSILIDRSPLWMLSGLGALSAILLLVFKDTLLSLVASTQLTSNDMLRIGDWIEMPQCNADGYVKDIALHTVKVQNWDNTVTTVPTYKLFSESYRNYRQMFESGARRIKRTLRIDAGSVRFLSDDEVHALMRFRLLHDYLEQKQSEVDEANRLLIEAGSDPVNRRRLTNIGTFRAYGIAYLKAHPEIHQELLLNVRMMEADSQGIPVEVYCFTRLTAWMDYERIQGDIFDHLLAILPELSLRLYQAPSGADLSGVRLNPVLAAAQVVAAQAAPPVQLSTPMR
ncbi:MULTISPECIES: mechanosensitive ion channel family protein [Cupriavidus]|uniref:MscS Mechanosensitive ion channel n=1 Tax=Cupriavidus pinatubonensis (strain JMP 134 / LMG 1197) TaxID=264198 RepID=Q470L7_CUPPJ|nr:MULTISPECIES: mechanosensitive ion channel domain-containing protein [Cupriavidus]QYY30017.1 mechanosensitive ion channel family protein [Cupriavidus pinatubonensis]TPQ41066.1 mechanosensitive ion channel protein MscS [Cupriavidus pinatubonensis]